MSENPLTAAIILIGDEILTGKTVDKNGAYASHELFKHGIELHEMVVIPDISDVIVSTIHRLKSRVDLIFTSGGIGSTHDDITYESIAQAFDVGLYLDEPFATKMMDGIRKKRTIPSLEQLIHEDSPLLKMATFPVGSNVSDTPDLFVPLVCFQDIYVFPGIPGLFRPMFDHLLKSLPGQKKSRHLLFTDRVEGQFASQLSDIQDDFKNVAIGSYPAEPGKSYRVKISCEGYEPVQVATAAGVIQRMLESMGGTVRMTEE